MCYPPFVGFQLASALASTVNGQGYLYDSSVYLQCSWIDILAELVANWYFFLLGWWLWICWEVHKFKDLYLEKNYIHFLVIHYIKCKWRLLLKADLFIPLLPVSIQWSKQHIELGEWFIARLSRLSPETNSLGVWWAWHMGPQMFERSAYFGLLFHFLATENKPFLVTQSIKASLCFGALFQDSYEAAYAKIKEGGMLLFSSFWICECILSCI